MTDRNINWNISNEGNLCVGSYVYRVAYARNGNAHNPTQYRRWAVGVRSCDGSITTVGSGFRTRREATAAFEIFASELS